MTDNVIQVRAKADQQPGIFDRGASLVVNMCDASIAVSEATRTFAIAFGSRDTAECVRQLARLRRTTEQLAVMTAVIEKHIKE